ncbi:MAG: cache domain-containing protein [Halioglobus sp.]
MKFWLGWILGLAVMLVVLVWGFSQWNLRYYNQYIGERLELLVDLRQGAVQEYFSTAEAELRFWSGNQTIVDAIVQMNETWTAHGDSVAADIYDLYVTQNPSPAGYLLDLDDAGDGSQYSALHKRVHDSARQFVTRRGYYDFFLIGPEGDVYYTVEKERDFTTNLLTGPWKDSGLATAFDAAKRGRNGKVIAISDMRAYGPSAGAPAVFVATALHDEQAQFVGVLALQLPTDVILGIMAYTSGMGETGETYLVGQDLLMRSDSRFSAQSTVLTQQVDSPTVQLALAGEQGRGAILDYRGIEVLSAYMPLEIGKFRWAVMAEMDVAEVVDFAASERPALSGALVLIYGLSLWTVWYWRGRRMPDDKQHTDLATIDISEGDSGGMSD